MRESSAISVPKRFYAKHCCPGWNTSSHRRAKCAWRRWKQAGKPNDPDTLLTSAAKKSFVNNIVPIYLHKAFYDKLDNTSNPDKFFGLFCRKFGTKPNLTTSLKIRNLEFNHENIIEGWAHHFEDLGKPSHGTIDNSFGEVISSDLSEYEMSLIPSPTNCFLT